MQELSIRDIVQLILKRWWIPAAGAILCAIAAALISLFLLKPVYESSTTLYVNKKVDQTAALSYNDVMLDSQLVKDYQELVKSRLVAATVIQQLNLDRMTVEQFSRKLQINLKSDTRVIQITAQDGDPALARSIAEKVAEVFQQMAIDIMQVENVKLIDRAELPVKPVKPNKTANVSIAFILGLMAGFGAAFLIEYLDNTVKTPDDVKRCVGLPIIGTIPVFPESGKGYVHV